MEEGGVAFLTGGTEGEETVREEKKKEGCLLWGNVIGLLEEEEMSLLLEVLAKR